MNFKQLARKAAAPAVAIALFAAPAVAAVDPTIDISVIVNSPPPPPCLGMTSAATFMPMSAGVLNPMIDQNATTSATIDFMVMAGQDENCNAVNPASITITESGFASGVTGKVGCDSEATAFIVVSKSCTGTALSLNIDIASAADATPGTYSNTYTMTLVP